MAPKRCVLMTNFFLMPVIAGLFVLSACSATPPNEAAGLRKEDAEFNREDCVYPAIWHDNSQVCWEGHRGPEGR